MTRTHPILPTTAQVRQLARQYSTIIPPDWQDRNGHVNVQFYLTLYEIGGYQIFEEAGVGTGYLSEHDFGLFDLEHHLCYRCEILVGDEVSTYNRILSANAKRFHGMYFTVNDRRDELASTLEYVTTGVDLQTRRSAPFPDKLMQSLKRQITKQQLLQWAAPVCGVMKP